MLPNFMKVASNKVNFASHFTPDLAIHLTYVRPFLLLRFLYHMLSLLPSALSFISSFVTAHTVVISRPFLSPSHLLSHFSSLIFSVLSRFTRLKSNWCRWVSALVWHGLLLEVLIVAADWPRECFTWLHHIFEKLDFWPTTVWWARYTVCVLEVAAFLSKVNL